MASGSHREHVPVLVGVGRITQHKGSVSIDKARSPLEMMYDACKLALEDLYVEDTGKVLESVDSVATVNMQLELRVLSALREQARLSGSKTQILGYDHVYTNPPRTLAKSLGVPTSGLQEYISDDQSGNSPQMLVNEMCERIAQKKIKTAIISGCEALATFSEALKQGYTLPCLGETSVPNATGERIIVKGSKVLQWGDDPGDSPEILGHLHDEIPMNIDEVRSGLASAPACYALIDQACRQKSSYKDLSSHMKQVGEMMEGFTQVAAAQPEHSWFPIKRTAHEIVTLSEQNRMVAYPYPKFCNAVMDVDQAAALIIMSEAEAAKFKIPKHRWTYLHGCSDTYEYPVHISKRRNLDRNFAMQVAAKQALDSAQVTMKDITLFDIYSCFPVAVSMACKEMEIPTRDGTRLTLTGGLPYHGGPGNNYSMHAIAAMVQSLRQNRGEYGMVTANGGFLSKHSVGIYSCVPYKESKWKRVNPELYQLKLNEWAQKNNHQDIAKLNSEGSVGVIDTWTVVYNKHKGENIPKMATILGTVLAVEDSNKNDNAGKRFVAMCTDPSEISKLISADGKDSNGEAMKCVVTRNKKHRNTFRLYDKAHL
eukprot:m.124492 g.124492  ORF g.124492 m.124492 type:complete len:597 (-) comp14473_c0_seq2:32-1822(-)